MFAVNLVALNDQFMGGTPEQVFNSAVF